METDKCKAYLTFEQIEEAFKKRPDDIPDYERARLDALHNQVTGCLYECYHDTFMISLVTLHKNSYRENRIEDAAEDAFITALEKFEEYVAKHGLYRGAQIKTIFYKFCTLTFLNNRKAVINNPAGDPGPDPDGDTAIDDDEEEASVKEKKHTCLDEFLQQKSRCAKVIILRHFKKLSAPQLAELLGVTPRFATVLVGRCMKRLRAFMETCVKKSV